MIQKYIEAGLAPIPIKANSKYPPLHKGYDSLPIEEQWKGIEKANIGLRCGDGFAVIDCDDQSTVELVKEKLSSMGVIDKTVQVETYSGNRQFYLKLKNVPNDISYKLLKIGEGEFRVNKCYVVAPGSIVKGKEYKFVYGDLDLYTNQPVLDFQDFKWLIDFDKPESDAPKLDKSEFSDRASQLPVPLIIRDLKEHLQSLFDKAKVKKGTTGYKSRSEIEGAIVSILILYGWTFEQILEEFKKQQPGHFREHRNPTWYLNLTYEKALDKIASSEIRKSIAKAYEMMYYLPYTNPDGGNDRNSFYNRSVLLGLLAKAYEFETFVIKVSCRELSEYCAISKMAVSNTLKRLMDIGYIEKDSKGFFDLRKYKSISQFDPEFIQRIISNFCISNVINVQEEDKYIDVETKELFSRNFLGKTCEMVYQVLPSPEKTSGSGGLRPKDIMKAIKKGKNSTNKALHLLEGHGLAKKIDKTWYRGDTSLDCVAKEFAVLEVARRRRNKHKIEREFYQQSIMEQNKKHEIFKSNTSVNNEHTGSNSLTVHP